MKKRLLLVAALLVYALAFQGSRGLYAPDEGRYVGVALEMLRDGDWIHPRLHPEQPHYTKPPVTYWAIASSLALLGDHEWAARLPNALAYVLTVLLVLGLGHRLVPERPWDAALVHATCAGPYLAANIVTTDTLLALFETLAGYAFVVAWWDGKRRARSVLLLWTALGLAFLTKGPPGLLPLLALVPFVVLRRGWRELARFAPPLGLLLFLLLGFSWYVKVALDRPELWNRFLAHEVIGRVASAEHHRNAQWYAGFLVYGGTLLAGALPWTIPCLIRAFRAARPGLLQRARTFLASEQNLLCALWLCLPLLVLVCARSRLSLYVLPFFVPLSLLVARLLRHLEKRSRVVFVGLLLWAMLLVGARAVAARVPYPDKDDRLLAASIETLAGRPREVAFVGSAPRYGVGFYLGAEVERLATGEEISAAGPVETLLEEWREGSDARDEPRVYLVATGVEEGFERLAEDAGRSPVRRGAVAGFSVYLAPLR